jgi:sulfite reductase (ferredoxin)
METIFELPNDSQADLDRFGQEIAKFETGKTSEAEFRAFRVPRGVYEQRESGTYMLRARCPAGMVLPHQMRALAAVSRRYGNGVLHVTTRQDVQIHRVLLKDIHPALVELQAAGLSTKGGGGNTVRNITGCYDAGVCAHEVFDPTPYVIALTEFLLPDPLSYQLPRKYKIAFSGCPRDCSGATINDLGFVAGRRGDARGFAVYVGGGMGATSRVGDLLEAFVPAEEAHLTAEAIKRVFDQHGNRRNRHRARIRFLVEDIGLPRFRELYLIEFRALRDAGVAMPAMRAVSPRSPSQPRQASETANGFSEWQNRCAMPQKQGGYALVHIPLFLGDIDAGHFEKLAAIVEQYGEGALRATQRQNLVLRWVHQTELPALHARLQAIGLANAEAPLLANLVACTGASTCRLGICLSRGLAKALRGALTAASADLDGIEPLNISISGCPNSCGRHPVADIGLFGAARRANGRLVPQYVLQLGGHVAEGETRLAQGEQAIPAKNVPALVAELLAAFRRSPQHPDFARFLDAYGDELKTTLVPQYQVVPDFNVNKDFYIDWDANSLFSLAGRGPGECGAGVFDLIEVDLEGAREALKAGRLLEATLLAARALLVTRGEQANSETEVLELFSRLFLDEGLVEPSFGVLVGMAKAAVKTNRAGDALDIGEVSKFLARVEKLYADMGTSLRFKPAPQEPVAKPVVAATETPPAAALPPVDREADFRGVVCPLNYVKTKMLLGPMKSGSVLSVLLDEAGSRNVPASVEKDGHEVLSVEEEQGHWRVRIRRG